MVTEQKESKITYTTMGVDQAESFNRKFDEAVRTVEKQLGLEYPVFIDGRARKTAAPTFNDTSPIDTRMVLGTFQDCGASEADAAIKAARRAYGEWSRLPWQERVACLSKAAANFRARKFEISAWLCLEAGKPRLEAMGEVEEAADLITTYCEQVERHDGYVTQLGQLSPAEVNHSFLKPYGVWVVIAPFNFPVALTTGMVAGALVAGNPAVLKPSEETPLTGLKVYECFEAAGLPPGVLNILTGRGNEIGESLSTHPLVDGMVFTGSKRVGTHVYSEFSRKVPRPCITEMGGKNPVIVTKNADLDKAVEGTVRAAFGFSGQKCSAASRVYVDESVIDEYVTRVSARTKELLVGDVRHPDAFMGPVINQKAYERFREVCTTAGKDGQILAGGEVLTDGDLGHGYYCAPTLARLPIDHSYFYDELFVPFAAIASVQSLDEAMERANDSEYGLTAGVYSEDPKEVQQFLDGMEAGVLYVNRRAGATTGAWPGIQSFGGWKASGSPGKSALGPYYVEQFLREQNQTVVTD